MVVDLDVALLVVAVALPVFLVAAVVATFPLGLAVLLEVVLIVLVLELLLSIAVAVVFDEEVLVVLGGELEDSTFARFATGPFCGKIPNYVYGVKANVCRMFFCFV